MVMDLENFMDRLEQYFQLKNKNHLKYPVLERLIYN